MGNYKSKTTTTFVTEEHFKMFLQHDGELCLCPGHDDESTGSVSYVEFSTGNTGIHCWVCDMTWNLYDTIKLVDKNSILKYSKILNNIDEDLIKENETVEKKIKNVQQYKKVVKEYYNTNFDLKEYYNALITIVFNEVVCKDIYDKNKERVFIEEDRIRVQSRYSNSQMTERLIKDKNYLSQLKMFCPFLGFLGNAEKKINLDLLKKIKYDLYAESLVIPFFCDNDLNNTFFYRDFRGKYVPKMKWERNGRNYYDTPIFWEEAMYNKKANNNNFLLICEGVKDAFNANLLGYSAMTSGGVTNTRPFDNDESNIYGIEANFEYIVIALDNDEAGRKNIFRYTELFKKSKVLILTKIFEENEDFTDFMLRNLIFEEDFKLEI